jgi:hypothetical protein
VKTHVQVIGWLNIVLGAGALLAWLVVTGVFGALGVAAASDPAGREALPWIGVASGFVGAVLLATAATSIVVGVGLLGFAPWARILAIVLSILHLANATTLGLSTVLGVYSLVILFLPETAQLFERRGTVP